MAAKALELAYRAIGSRERTVQELRRFLARKNLDDVAIEEAVDELCEAGLLDDERYARRFAEDRRTLDHWGPDRIARDLRRRGVADEWIERALADRGRSDELAAALQLLELRIDPPADDRERDRAWKLLVRRGYDSELAYEAVRAHGRSAAG